MLRGRALKASRRWLRSNGFGRLRRAAPDVMTARAVADLGSIAPDVPERLIIGVHTNHDVIAEAQHHIARRRWFAQTRFAMGTVDVIRHGKPLSAKSRTGADAAGQTGVITAYEVSSSEPYPTASAQLLYHTPHPLAVPSPSPTRRGRRDGGEHHFLASRRYVTHSQQYASPPRCS